ncbi:MAG: hypothetical protein M5R36_27020 [Deltaproteobacteria bacterium]|nr:hypothetical protein [Deltaproteobacteria bacterium]
MAIALLQDCLDEQSPDLKVLNLLAGLRLKARQFDEAERLYRLGIRHNPEQSNLVAALAADRRVARAIGKNRPKSSAFLPKPTPPTWPPVSSWFK